ncbi:MAG: HAMP domain-containing sensor histidine kinase [Cyanobacteria bacterium P01_F01_bin.42]
MSRTRFKRKTAASSGVPFQASSSSPYGGDALPDKIFREMVERSSDVTLIVNSAGGLGYVSSSVLTAFGFCPESSSLEEFLHWFHPDDRSEVSTLFASTLEGSQKLCARLRHHWGHWLNCLVLAQTLGPHLAEQLQTAEQTKDHWYWLSLHLLDQCTCQLKIVDNTARENEQMKSHFLAIVSHELRTPINAINGFSQLLLRQRRDRLSSEQEDMVQSILTNGKNLLSLINNVLDLSKLEAGRMSLHLEQLNVTDLIEGTIKGLSPLITENNLTLTTEFHLSDPVIVNDPLRLKQILMNLLSNAIKFSRGGQVWVVVEEFDLEKLRISVQDSGPGIASDDILKVFSEFWQVDQLPSRQHQGTGLGLAISHNLAKMMQGDIQVHSELGHGATFRLVVPRQVSQGASLA